MKFLKLLIAGLAFSSFSLHAEQNLSHALRTTSFEKAKKILSERIEARGDLPYATVKTQLDLVTQLSEFPLGQFMIERGGLNGYWTHYVVTFPEKKNSGKEFHPLEAFILNNAPTCVATQQRYQIFKTEIKKHLKEGGSYASVPCGMMGEFLDLDYSGLKKFSICGIDIDSETLEQAKEYAKEKGLVSHCRFLEKDAWNLGLGAKFDLIASNGLAIYVQDDKKVVDLYKQFHNSLKPNGILVTSFLTPPPAPGSATEWLLSEVNPQYALLQKIIFVDVLDTKWQAYRTEETVKRQLKEAGFSEIEVIYDKAHIFPTVIAKKKPLS